MEIDGVVLDTPVSAYTFDTVGEHVIKYTLTDNTTIGVGAFYYCENLSSITYNSTMAQWASISKGDEWYGNVPATVVHCTDGDTPI